MLANIGSGDGLFVALCPQAINWTKEGFLLSIKPGETNFEGN